MSTNRDVTRSVRSWLKEDRHEDADRVLDIVLDQLDTTPQRRAGWLARRFPLMNNSAIRYGIAAAAVVLAVVIGINFLSDPNVGGGPDSTATQTPTATPNAAVGTAELPFGDHPLNAGTYSLEPSFPVRITFEVPEGWTSCSSGVVEQCVRGGPEDLSGAGVSFLIVDNVIADPCGPYNLLLDPPVGPSVEDLVTAISNLDGFEATAPMDVTVDGFQGKQFTVTAPAVPGCELKTWVTANRTNGVGAAEINELRILDVDGVRVLIIDTYFPEQSEESRSAVNQVLASIQIEP